MRYRRGMPVGATVVVCAMAIASSAMADSVCPRPDDVVALASEDSCRESVWIAQILGERKDRSHRASAASAQDPPAPRTQWAAGSYEADSSDSAAGPRPAAVIPLPAPLWSGLAGLGALVFASAVRKVRKVV